MAKNRNTYMKRSRELEHRQRAETKRKRRQLKKQNTAAPYHARTDREASDATIESEKLTSPPEGNTTR